MLGRGAVSGVRDNQKISETTPRQIKKNRYLGVLDSQIIIFVGAADCAEISRQYLGAGGCARVKNIIFGREGLRDSPTNIGGTPRQSTKI